MLDRFLGFIVVLGVIGFLIFGMHSGRRNNTDPTLTGVWKEIQPYPGAQVGTRCHAWYTGPSGARHGGIVCVPKGGL